MYLKKRIIFTVMMCCFVYSTFAQVPALQFKKPEIPYFMESMDFQSVRMQIFSTHYSGLVTDKYSDLNWNPASINQIDKKYFYIDFTKPNNSPVNRMPSLSSDAYSDNYFVRPSWYSSTSYNSVDYTPVYNAAILLPLSERLKIGVFHRLVFDYSPFLMKRSYSYSAAPTGGLPYTDDYELKRLEAEDNQQTTVGSQTQVIVGLDLFTKLDIGLLLGHYLYRQDGELYDSEWGYFPHQSFADLNKDKLEVNGDQYEIGIGGLYHLSDEISIGAYIGQTIGDGKRMVTESDTSDNWTERDTDPDYYNFSHSYLTSQSNSDVDSDRPKFTLMFEWKLKDDLKLRSSFSYIQLNSDFSGNIAARDTSNGERTYDQYVNSNLYAFRKQKTESFRYTSLTGNGKERSEIINGYVSLIYQPTPEWTLFGGFYLLKQNYHFQADEQSTNKNGSFNLYTLWDPGSNKSYYIDDKRYLVKSDRNLLIGSIPIGLFAEIYKGFSIIIGTDLVMSYTENESSSDLLYKSKLQQKWENGSQTVDDLEENRRERFISQEPKLLTRTTNTYLGFQYRHTSGMNFYVKASDDLFSFGKWGFGFELEL